MQAGAGPAYWRADMGGKTTWNYGTNVSNWPRGQSAHNGRDLCPPTPVTRSTREDRWRAGGAVATHFAHLTSVKWLQLATCALIMRTMRTTRRRNAPQGTNYYLSRYMSGHCLAVLRPPFLQRQRHDMPATPSRELLVPGIRCLVPGGRLYSIGAWLPSLASEVQFLPAFLY